MHLHIPHKNMQRCLYTRNLSTERVFSHREALRDGKFYIKEKNSCSESCAGSDGLFGITEYTSNARKKNMIIQNMISAQRKFPNQVLCKVIKTLYNHNITVYSKKRNAFNTSDSFHTHFILMMSMPVTVRLT